MLYVYDTCANNYEESKLMKLMGKLLFMRYMVTTKEYPHGDIIAFGPTPGIALWKAKRQLRQEPKSKYPPLVRMKDIG